MSPPLTVSKRTPGSTGKKKQMPTFGKVYSYVSTYPPRHFGKTLWPSSPTHVNTHFRRYGCSSKILSRLARTLLKDLTAFSSFGLLSARATRRTGADKERAKALRWEFLAPPLRRWRRHWSSVESPLLGRVCLLKPLVAQN